MRYSLAVAFLCVFYSGQSQTPYACGKVAQLKSMLEKYHIDPPSWDSKFHEQVVDQVFYLLDPNGMYFLSEEYGAFRKRSAGIGSLLAHDCKWIEELSLLYTKALDRTNQLVSELRTETLNFNLADTITLHTKQPLYSRDLAALRRRWEQQLRLEILQEAVIAEKSEQFRVDPARQSKMCDRYADIIKRKKTISGGISEFVFYRFMNAFATTCDPHGQYFSKRDSQAFLEMLQSDGLSFGIVLAEDVLGRVSIGRIVPGSSAWESRSLSEGDAVVAIKGASTPTIDASLYSAAELDELIETIDGWIELTVRKVTGEESRVTLAREKLQQDENKIMSLLIAKEGTQFGYVSLPIFYQSGEFSANGCARDLALEIIQLKKAGISGLILDLRDNGGGSLEEALAMAGIFIDRGAVGIELRKGEEPEALRDLTAGTAYDGPLLILINGGSASASELLAMAMRDHNRAILAGSTTYGKGTGQTFMPFTGGDGDMVKITTFRFFGVKGESNQSVGVVPDIVLPSVFDALVMKESEERHVLRKTDIVKKTYYTPWPPLPIGTLRDSALLRISRSTYFANQQRMEARIREYYRGGTFRIPLSPEGVAGFRDVIRFDEQETEILPHVQMTKQDQQINAIDTYGRENYLNFIESVKQDHYIAESINILMDIKQMKK